MFVEWDINEDSRELVASPEMVEELPGVSTTTKGCRELGRGFSLRLAIRFIICDRERAKRIGEFAAMFWVDGDIVGGLNCRFELDGKTFRDPSTVAKLMFKDWLKLEEIQASERTSMFETVLVWASG